MDFLFLAEATANTMDANIPMYVFALISGVVGIFTIGSWLLNYCRNGDIDLHKKVEHETEKGMKWKLEWLRRSEN